MIKELLITFLAMTKTTEYAANWLGVKPFLPALSGHRFALLSLREVKDLLPEMEACTSFKDDKWTSYWTTISLKYLRRIEERVGENLGGLLEGEKASSKLNALLAGGISLIRDTPPGTPVDVERFIKGNPGKAEEIRTLDDAIKAISNLFLASWPGKTPIRDACYRKSTALFDVVLDAVAEPLGLDLERDTIQVEGESVKVYFLAPKGDELLPAVLNSNGLEGTNQELMLPSLHIRSNNAQFFVEMPGTYAYKNPIHPERTTKIYRAFIDHMANHPRVDANRIGMLGVSFGAHWSTRMALMEPRLKAVVSNGGLYSHSFGQSGALGKPEIMMEILKAVTGAKSPIEMGSKFHALILTSKDLSSIKIPILAINGDKDTLCSTQDTIDLGQKAPLGELLIYSHDDHCAMDHLSEWIVYSNEWMEAKL